MHTQGPRRSHPVVQRVSSRLPPPANAMEVALPPSPPSPPQPAAPTPVPYPHARANMHARRRASTPTPTPMPSPPRPSQLDHRPRRPDLLDSLLGLSSSASSPALSSAPSSPPRHRPPLARASSALSLLYAPQPPPSTSARDPPLSASPGPSRAPTASPSVVMSPATATGTLRAPRKTPGAAFPFVPLTPILASPRLTPELGTGGSASLGASEPSRGQLQEKDKEKDKGKDKGAFQVGAQDIDDYLTRGLRRPPRHLCRSSSETTISVAMPAEDPPPTWTSTPPTPPQVHPASLAPDQGQGQGQGPALARGDSTSIAGPNTSRAGRRPASVAVFPAARSASSPSSAQTRSAPWLPLSMSMSGDAAHPRRRLSLPPDLSKPLPAPPAPTHPGPAPAELVCWLSQRHNREGSLSPSPSPSPLRASALVQSDSHASDASFKSALTTLVPSPIDDGDGGGGEEARLGLTKKGSARKLFHLDGDGSDREEREREREKEKRRRSGSRAKRGSRERERERERERTVSRHSVERAQPRRAMDIPREELDVQLKKKGSETALDVVEVEMEVEVEVEVEVVTVDTGAEERRGRETETRAELERLRAGTRRYHALMELLTTEVGYLADLRALVTVRLHSFVWHPWFFGPFLSSSSHRC